MTTKRLINLGSLNLDHVYRVDQFVRPGETLCVEDYQQHLGGKGLNHSAAAARAGAQVLHVGACPKDAFAAFRAADHPNLDWHILDVETPCGHAVIQVDSSAENQILLFPGANLCLTLEHLGVAKIRPGDWFLTQNETNLVPQAIKAARDAGANIAYAAAPFDAQAVAAIYGDLDLIALNEIEYSQLCQTLGETMGQTLGETMDETMGDAKDQGTATSTKIILETRGAAGVCVHQGDEKTLLPAFRVDPLDTTGAGDCFFGAFLSHYMHANDLMQAVRFGQAASALQIQQPGAANAMPTKQQIEAFLNDHATQP